jgi:hypothetical protein
MSVVAIVRRFTVLVQIWPLLVDLTEDIIERARRAREARHERLSEIFLHRREKQQRSAADAALFG